MSALTEAEQISALWQWAAHAATDLRVYADAARLAGTPQVETEALLRTLEDIRERRPLWQAEIRGTVDAAIDPEPFPWLD
jgi:hypothetical protein